MFFIDSIAILIGISAFLVPIGFFVLLSVSKRLGRLESLVQSLPARLGPRQSSGPQPSPRVTTPEVVTPGLVAPPPSVELPPVWTARPPKPPSSAATAREETVPATAENETEPHAETLEAALGLRWMVRAGAVLLLFGMAFFYRYAVNQGWLPPTARAALGALLGVTLMALAEHFHRRNYRALCHGFLAGGLAIVALTTRVSQSVYGLFGPGIALTILVDLCALGAYASVRYRALPLAILNGLFAFSIPWLAWPFEQTIPFFVYHGALVFAFLVVADRQAWSPLPPLLAVGTVIQVGASYVFSDLVRSECSLEMSWVLGSTVLVALFIGVLLVWPWFKKSAISPVGLLVSLGLTPVWLWFVNRCLAGAYPLWSRVFCAGAASALYLGLGLAPRTAGLISSSGRELLRSLGAALLVVAIEQSIPAGQAPLQLVLLTVAAIALAYGAKRWKSSGLTFGVLLSVVAGALSATIVFGDLQRTPRPFLWNFELGSLVLFAAALLRLSGDLGTRKSTTMRDSMRLGAKTLLLAAASREAGRYFSSPLAPDAGTTAVTIVWIVMASALLALGFVRSERLMRLAGVALLGATGIKVVVFDLAGSTLLARIISFVALGLVLMAFAWLYHRLSTRLFDSPRRSASHDSAPRVSEA